MDNVEEGKLVDDTPSECCEWEFNSEYGRWETECDDVIALHNDENPFDYGFRFCPYCGKFAKGLK